MSERWVFVLGAMAGLAVADVLLLLMGFFAGLLAGSAFLVMGGFFLGCLFSGVLGGMLRS